MNAALARTLGRTSTILPVIGTVNRNATKTIYIIFYICNFILCPIPACPFSRFRSCSPNHCYNAHVHAPELATCGVRICFIDLVKTEDAPNAIETIAE